MSDSDHANRTSRRVLALGALPNLRERLLALECENDQLRLALREIREYAAIAGEPPA